MKQMLLPLLLFACAPAPKADSTPPEFGAGACDAKAAQSLIGLSISDAVVARAKKATGAGAVRVIRPGQAVTMDYRTDRLNIELDSADRIVRFTCG